MRRRLISFYEEKHGENAGKFYISYAYYTDEEDEWIPKLSEHAHITPDQLHKALKNHLKKGDPEC